MYTAQSSAASGGFTAWPRRAERFLDERGKGAWIAATVLGFIVFWPIGLGLLAYMIWSNRMFNRSACAARRAAHMPHGRAWSTSGNSAFDAYKAETLRRLEEEQHAFESFLQRLRDAKDKSEFDTFMEDRARNAGAERPAAAGDTAPEAPRAGSY